jgi:hypothetical protein
MLARDGEALRALDFAIVQSWIHFASGGELVERQFGSAVGTHDQQPKTGKAERRPGLPKAWALAELADSQIDSQVWGTVV